MNSGEGNNLGLGVKPIKAADIGIIRQEYNNDIFNLFENKDALQSMAKWI